MPAKDFPNPIVLPELKISSIANFHSCVILQIRPSVVDVLPEGNIMRVQLYLSYPHNSENHTSA